MHKFDIIVTWPGMHRKIDFLKLTYSSIVWIRKDESVGHPCIACKEPTGSRIDHRGQWGSRSLILAVPCEDIGLCVTRGCAPSISDRVRDTHDDRTIDSSSQLHRPTKVRSGHARGCSIGTWSC